jgi:uncharacterized membrane protein YgcG
MSVAPGSNSPVATSLRGGAHDLLAAAEQRIEYEHGRALSGSVAWLLRGFEGMSAGVPGFLPPPGVWDGNIHRELNRTLGTLRGRNARELLGAADRGIQHAIGMSLRGRGPWVVTRGKECLTFVPRHLARMRSLGERRWARSATRRCGPRSSRQRRCRVTGRGGGGDGSPGDGGGGGSIGGDSGGDGDPDPEAPAVGGSESVVWRGGRHGS